MPLVVSIATTSNFRAADPTDPRFSVLATLFSGILKFEIIAQLPSGQRGSNPGKAYFNEMMSHFGAAVRIIESDWSISSGLTTNIDALNRATAAGLNLTDAASFTWTGLRSSEYGFVNVKVLSATPTGSGHTFESVRVQFSK